MFFVHATHKSTHMELQGWMCVEAMEKWEHYIKESIQGIYRWPGGEIVYEPGSDPRDLTRWACASIETERKQTHRSMHG